MKYRKPWNYDNTNWLINNFHNKSNKELAELLSLSVPQVQHKGIALKLRKTKEARSCICRQASHMRIISNYTDEQVKNLFEQTRDYKYVSDLTGISIVALASRNSRYWHIVVSPWTTENTNQLIALFPNKSDKEIATILNLSVIQVQSKARKLKLKKAPEYLKLVFDKVSKNIASGPNRFQNASSSPNWLSSLRRGEQHHAWKKDRTKLKGRRRAAFRFSILITRLIREEQLDQCKHCDITLYGKGEFDHIVPVFAGGLATKENCQLLCYTCHRNKSKQERRQTNNFWQNR